MKKVALKQLIISPKSYFAGKSIRDSDIRENTKGMIVVLNGKENGY
jgi:K+/H+ antiporter YhaU regulatory subunit KhtT